MGRDLDRDLERLAVMRDALGPGPGGSGPSLMIDANEFWSPKQAIRHISAFEREFDLVWAEEPVRRGDHRGLARVSHAVRTSVATGENLTAPQQFAPLVLDGSADILQMAVGNVGITGALRIAETADTFGMPFALVNCPGRYAAHVAAAMPNHLMMEVLDVGRDAVFTTGHTIEDGEIPARGDTRYRTRLRRGAAAGARRRGPVTGLAGLRVPALARLGTRRTGSSEPDPLGRRSSIRFDRPAMHVGDSPDAARGSRRAAEDPHKGLDLDHGALHSPGPVMIPVMISAFAPGAVVGRPARSCPWILSGVSAGAVKG